MTGLTLVEGINPITDGFQTVGSVTITLAGTIPFVWFLTRVAEKPLERLGQLIGVNAIRISIVRWCPCPAWCPPSSPTGR